MNQLDFVSTKTYLEEFIMFEEAEDSWGVAGVVNVVRDPIRAQVYTLHL